MNETNPPPSIPEPNIPTPDIPTPSIPTPDIPSPNLNTQGGSPPISRFETGAMEPVGGSQQAGESEEVELIEEEPESILFARIAGGLIDGLIAGILSGISQMIFPESLSIIGYLLGTGYLLTRDALPFLKGQSLGKRVMKLRAVTEQGQPLTGHWVASVLRNLTIAIPLIAVIDLIILYRREKGPKSGLRLGDEIGKTKVVVWEG